MELIVPLVMVAVALLYVLFSVLKIKKMNPGTEKMVEISNAIQKGAMAFLKREYRTLVFFVIFIAFLLGYLLGWLTSLSYLLGTFMSSLAGLIGMIAATKTNSRTAHQAKDNFPGALRTAFSGGSVMGFSVVGLGLLGLIVILSVSQQQEVLLAYGFGASSIALFLRVGGGIFTKSADVGADLVGKVEKGIPEDDPRNPAVIADNVGDNVGDIAGMGSDLFESYVSSILAASILGVIAFGSLGMGFPVLLAAAGILASIIGTLFVRSGKSSKSFSEQSKSASSALNRGVMASSILFAVFAYYLATAVLNNINVFFAVLSGLIVGYLIGRITEYYTSDKFSPVKSIAESAQTGAATNLIEGLSAGMISTVMPIILVSVATLVSFQLAGLFGIAIAAVGMLSTLGMILSIDGYGPIADNAAGIAEMAELGEETREKCEALDSVGNTTAAIGKGFAISSAALTALAWLATFFGIAGLKTISITNPNVIVGLFIGGMLPFLFASLTLRAVGKGAFEIIKEVRRQFKEIKGLMAGKAKPDYEKCIDITTKKAIKEMIKPGVIVLIAPIVIGLLLGLEALGGLLAGTLISGFMMAIMMANAGGAWDNAKKYIEAGNLGGKGSDAHKAAIVGDTVGDGMKDCSGPSLNILIKLIGIVTLIFTMVLLAM
jgi:K(+)-stimulated pyrophosphate-energized sodium pump